MNNSYIYPGYYGRTDREIYEAAMRGETDPSLKEAIAQVPLDLKLGPLERFLEAIFGNYRRMREERKHNKEELH